MKKCFICGVKKPDKKFKKHWEHGYYDGASSYHLSADCRQCIKKQKQT